MAKKDEATKGDEQSAKQEPVQTGPANDKVVGEGSDANFDAVSHGQQTALENAAAEAKENENL
jgi:hypothetical protein